MAAAKKQSNAPKCLKDHACTVAFTADPFPCGDTKNCSMTVRRAHWFCSRCKFGWCGNCKELPTEASEAAEQLFLVEPLDKAANTPPPTARKWYLVAACRKKIVAAIAACPAESDCFTALQVEGEATNYNNAKLAFLKLAMTEAENEVREKKDWEPYNLIKLGEELEKMALEIDPNAPQTGKVGRVYGEARKKAQQALEDRQAAEDGEKAVLRPFWLPYESGGTVTVGDVVWKYADRHLSHPTRPELKFRWAPWRFPGGNWGMKCTTGEKPDFGYMIALEWEEETKFKYYAAAGGVIEDLWVDLVLDKTSNAWVSKSPAFPSWKIHGNSVQSTSAHADIKHTSAIVQGSVPPCIVLFAVACAPLIDKIPAWASASLAKYEKIRQKEYGY